MKKKSKKRGLVALIIIVIILGLVGTGGYLAYEKGKEYYGSHFYPGTTVCGFDVGGMTLDQVYRKLETIKPSYSMTVTDIGGEETIYGDDFGLMRVIDSSVSDLLAAQDTKWWFKTFRNNNVTLDLQVSYDEQALKNRIFSLSCIKDQIEPQDAYIAKDEDGTYYVEPEVYGSKLNQEAIAKGLLDTIKSDLAQMNNASSYYVSTIANTYQITEDSYIRPTIFQDDETLNKTVEAYNSFYKRHIVIDLDDATETLYLSDVAELTEDLKIVVSYEKVIAYVKELGKKYDTYQTVRTFTDAKGNTVTAGGNEKDTFGYVLDEEATAEDLYQELLDMSQEKSYFTAWFITYGKGRSEKTADFGDTYITIDISTQTILAVKDGKILLEDQIISGKDSDEAMRTPEGVFCIWKKDTDTYLQGPDWYCHVDYWMPFTWEGDGLHDADWKEEGEFGGDTYVESGSHGCVNLRKEVAQILFENMDVGTPVIIYRSIPLEEEAATEEAQE